MNRRKRRAGLALLASAALLALACSRDAADGPGEAAGSSALATPGSERGRILGPFLERHWVLPVPPQGEPPPSFSEAEASLAPETCGACHPKQHAEWRTSLHAAAFSPGFAGQLIEGDLATPIEIEGCQTCHAPLSEQLPTRLDGGPSPHYEAALRQQGIVCAACHVRSHRRFGPPRRADAPPPPSPPPHGGFEARPEFLESRFCAACHQFFDDPGVNGKPLENTFREWSESPQAAAGRSCQSCHMPDRAHLWRGIHDPEMVRAAVDVELVPFELEGETLRAALVLRSRDVGHAFPTYVTPRVFVTLFQEDAGGQEIDGTRVQAVIGREIDFDASPWRERFDTRVAPGESVRLDYEMPRHPHAASLVGRVTVDPDFHYRGVFETLLETLQSPEARALIEEAVRRVSESRYELSETRRPLPHGPS